MTEEPLIEDDLPEDGLIPAEASAPEPATSEPAPIEGDDLDQLLAQWDEEAGRAASPPDTQPERAPLYDYSDQIRQASYQAWVDQEKLLAQQAGFERGVAAAREYAELEREVDWLAEATGTSPEIIKGYIRGLPEDERQRVDKMWESRSNKYVHQQLRTEIVGKVKRAVRPVVDESLTEDRMAVAAAVKGSLSEKSLPAEAPPNLGHLSDSEYRRYLADIGVGGF